MTRSTTRHSSPRAAALALVTSVVLAALCASADAANVFVSASGSDANSGQGPGDPKATVAAAIRHAGSNGTVYLKRGDRFREEVQLNGATLNAYGDAKAPPPAICGSVRIANFKPHKGSVYIAHVDIGKEIRHLFVDNRLVRIARFPNTGWLRAKKGSVASLLVDEDLATHPRNKPGYWNGAQVRWRRWSWWYETRPVASYDGAGRFTLGGKEEVGHFTGIGSAYYLDNKLEELDAPGEWFWDAEKKDVYLWAPEGDDPNAHLVEGMCLKQCTATGGLIENVAFSQFETGLRIGGAITLKGCLFEHNDFTAISATTQKGAHLVGNEFRDNLNVGIAWFNWNATDDSSVIEDNVLRRTGTVEGYGGSGAWHAAGIIVYGGAGLRIRYNLIDKTGYAGIILGAERNYAEYNVIRNAMATLNDGGGIYTNCHRSYIKGNLIIDTIGNLETSHPWYPLGHGIWLEFLGDFRESVVEDNMVIGSGGYGIFLPKNYECVIRNNNLYDNKIGQFQISDSTNPKHVVEKNVFYSTKNGQPTLVVEGSTDWGTFTDNVFACDGGGHIKNNGMMTVSGWQNKCAWADKTAREVKVANMASRVVFNNSKETAQIALDGGAWMDVNGQRYAKSIELKPYESRILFGGAGGAPLVLARAIDESARDAPRAVAAKAAPKKVDLTAGGPKRRTPKEGAVEVMDAQLQARLADSLAAGEKVSSFVSSFRQSLEIAGMDETFTLKLVARGGMNMSIDWPRLTPADKRGLAARVCRDNNEDDACLVAFYSLLQNDTSGAEEYLRRCPGRAADLEGFFETATTE